jgi:UDP:flavonoid glycosyltransferase YjiC (YdhE family)
MNSVSESLYYQVPLVMYPQTSEQSGVATRVEQLEAGLRIKKLSAESIREAVETVMNTSTYRENSIAISNGFKSCTGAKGAADKIEKLCKK